MAKITKVYLMNTLLEKDYKHTMYFESAAAQQQYFQKRIQSAMTFTDFVYQRKDQVIRIPKHIDSLYAAKVNYCMYQNTEYSNKWFYAFITDMKYINDGCTEVYIKTDCMQTWMFDITIKHSFVEREHATSDGIGEHTVPEGLELGEYYCIGSEKVTELTDCKYVIFATEGVSDNKTYATSVGGIPYAGGAYVCETLAELVSIINLFANDTKTDSIYAVYMIPSKIIEDNDEYMSFSGQGDPVKFTKKILTPNSVNGYVPKNKKLLTFPFSYLLLSNNAGTSNVLKYELFNNSVADGCEFQISGIPVVGGSIKCCPKRYNGVAVNQEEGVMCGKFPTLSWSADMFTNWLTQNSVNIALGIGAGAVQIVGGIATIAATSGAGAAIGGASVVGGVTAIANTLAQVHTQSFTPDSARGNTNGGDINTADGENTFYFYKMSIKAEFARIIDEYFNMFGYKCDRVKVPEKNHRENYWYTKTIDANIVGGIPQDDLQTIKDCYNNGITFWKNESYYRNYSVSNNIV